LADIVATFASEPPEHRLEVPDGCAAPVTAQRSR
jgi:hypothetical protein